LPNKHHKLRYKEVAFKPYQNNPWT